MEKRKHEERLKQYEKGNNRLEIEPLWKDCHWNKNIHEYVRITYVVNYKTHST